MKKSIISILSSIYIITNSINAYASFVPKESIPVYATESQIVVVENLINNTLDKVKSGMGYSDAVAESNRIIFKAWLNNKTDGFSFGKLAPIANNAIWQYRDMYLRPQFYKENEAYIKSLISPVIEDFKNGKIDYNKACFDARIKIYQSVDPAFNPDLEFSKDSCYRNIPSVDSSLFIIARKLIIELKS